MVATSSTAAAAATSAALAPPPGKQSNFIDPPNIQPAVIAGLTVCLGLATLSAALRTWAQLYLTKRLNWADFWSLLGWAFQVAFVGLLFACLPYGGGRHLWDVTKSDYAYIKFLLFTDYILYGCAILGAKVSILLQLIAIFVPRGRDLSASARWFYWSAQSLIAINLIFYVAHNFTLIFQCKPIAKGWDSKIPGTCMNQVSLLESSGPFNIISDILIFLLPLSTIWQLRLPIKTRLGIVSAFGVGLFGCICSGVRLYYSDRLNHSGDATYLVFQNQLWANAEITAAIIISNIIILPRFFRAKFGTASSGYGYPSGNSSRNLRSSRPKSMGVQQGSRFIQRKPSGDPYIELTEIETGSQTKKGFRADEDKQIERGTSQGILRTVEIDMTEESVKLPPHAVTTNHQADVSTEVTGNRTRLYDDDDV
ncbi:MAG: hypothetical protein MMC23_005463 [Stictis urceolatum]|nr:hypothetical protein [Stictis urceolata]